MATLGLPGSQAMTPASPARRDFPAKATPGGRDRPDTRPPMVEAGRRGPPMVETVKICEVVSRPRDMRLVTTATTVLARTATAETTGSLTLSPLMPLTSAQ